jgi:YHS domain-containing protein
MALPLFRAVLPILAATVAFAQTPAPKASASGDTIAQRHDTTLQAPAKKIKQPKAAAIVRLKPQSTCPVLGGPINKDLFVDYQGKRIYVCCAGCIDEVKKDPAKYIEKLRKAGESVAVIDSGKAKQSPQSSNKATGTKDSGMGTMKM